MTIYRLEICCDCCPYNPTCEELNDYHESIGLLFEEDEDAVSRV